jgi:hypothetical protein
LANSSVVGVLAHYPGAPPGRDRVGELWRELDAPLRRSLSRSRAVRFGCGAVAFGVDVDGRHGAERLEGERAGRYGDGGGWFMLPPRGFRIVRSLALSIVECGSESGLGDVTGVHFRNRCRSPQDSVPEVVCSQSNSAPHRRNAVTLGFPAVAKWTITVAVLLNSRRSASKFSLLCLLSAAVGQGRAAGVGCRDGL